MNIDFKRNRTQVKYEELVGISSVEELQNMKEEFNCYKLSSADVIELNNECEKDARDYLNNGMISLAEGISNMFNHRYTWATVKNYYSVFYFLRASMAANGVAILQNKSIYRLKIGKDEKPFSSGNRKYKSTHKGTISHYKDVFSGADRLLTNSIDDLDPYEWLEEVRNIANYREVSFLDPLCLDIWGKYDIAIYDEKIDDLIKNIVNDDDFIYCFQDDYAVVAIAIKRFQETIDDFKNNSLLTEMDDRKIDYICGIIPDEIMSLKNYIKDIFS